MAISITSPATRAAMLDASTAAGTTFDGALLGLTKSLIVPSKTASLATYTAAEADYHTYARTVQAWGLALQPIDGLVRFPGAANAFVLADLDVTESIYSYFLVDAGGTHLLAGGSLAAPQPLTTLVQGLILVPTVGWGVPLPQIGLEAPLLTTSLCDVDILSTLTGMTGLLHNAKAHLATLIDRVTPATTLAELAATEATYGGYAAQTISSWSAGYVDLDGVAKVGGTDLLWQPNSSATPNTITTVYVTDSTSATLLFAYTLDTPVTLSSALTGFRDAPTLGFGT